MLMMVRRAIRRLLYERVVAIDAKMLSTVVVADLGILSPSQFQERKGSAPAN
jgi:hypothetical protein